MFFSRSDAVAAERKTVVSIEGQAFHINGKPTYAGRTYNGMKVEGLLMNTPDGAGDLRRPRTPRRAGTGSTRTAPWDAERNTREFIAAMPEWRRHGLIAFTINLQGGSPQGYSKEQPWVQLGDQLRGRVAAAGRTWPGWRRSSTRRTSWGWCRSLGYFYFGQDAAVQGRGGGRRRRRRTRRTGCCAKGYTNVLVEIANECNVALHARDHQAGARRTS